MDQILILILSLALGGCGYLITTFWMAPMLRYLQIRHSVTSDLVFFANVIDSTNLNENLIIKHEKGTEVFRKHAAEMIASFSQLPIWYRVILWIKNENPIEASRNLIGLSNSNNWRDAVPCIQILKKKLRISKFC